MGAVLIEMQQVRVKLLNFNAQLPDYGSAEAAGADLYAAFYGDAIEVPAGGRAMIPTGIAIELLPGTEAQIRPRSGLAAKHGLTVLNTPGTIDSDYRGEIKVILHNTSDKPYYVNSGERIAQMVIAPFIRMSAIVVDELDNTARGENGFGSTGQ